MSYDLNPKFGEDQRYSETAREIADLLWETTNGDPSSFPRSYLEYFRHEYADGRVSMLELIDRVDLGPDATYEDYCEVVDLLMEVDPNEYGNPESIVEIQPSHLQYEVDTDFDFSEFDFSEEAMAPQEGSVNADPLSNKMELFLKKVISSVYRDGVTAVTDAEGNPPNEANRYLLSPDGSKFEGIFYDSPPNEEARQFPFTIVDKGGENWAIQY